MSWSFSLKGTKRGVIHSLATSPYHQANCSQSRIAKELIISELQANHVKMPFVTVSAHGHSDTTSGHGSLSINITYETQVTHPDEAEACSAPAMPGVGEILKRMPDGSLAIVNDTNAGSEAVSDDYLARS